MSNAFSQLQKPYEVKNVNDDFIDFENKFISNTDDQ